MLVHFAVPFVTSTYGPDGVIPFPADELSLDDVSTFAYLLNPSPVERTYRLDVHLELDSGSHDNWNWPGEPTPFSNRVMAPGGRKEIQIPLTWTSDGTPPVGTTGRLISPATTTIEGTSTSNTLEFPFVVAAPFLCE